MSNERLPQSLSFQLRTDSGVPPYRQLAQQVRQAVRMGTLEIGDRLPSVKEVVTELAINPNTVLKAYRELEYEGIVEGRQGVGTFVRSRPAGPPAGTQHRLARSLEKWVDSARREGMDNDAIEALVRDIVQATPEADSA